MPNAPQEKKALAGAALTEGQVVMRDAKITDLKNRIADKQSLIERMRENHLAEIAKVQSEIDEHQLMATALAQFAQFVAHLS